MKKKQFYMWVHDDRQKVDKDVEMLLTRIVMEFCQTIGKYRAKRTKK